MNCIVGHAIACSGMHDGRGLVSRRGGMVGADFCAMMIRGWGHCGSTGYLGLSARRGFHRLNLLGSRRPLDQLTCPKARRATGEAPRGGLRYLWDGSVAWRSRWGSARGWPSAVSARRGRIRRTPLPELARLRPAIQRRRGRPPVSRRCVSVADGRPTPQRNLPRLPHHRPGTPIWLRSPRQTH